MLAMFLGGVLRTRAAVFPWTIFSEAIRTSRRHATITRRWRRGDASISRFIVSHFFHEKTWCMLLKRAKNRVPILRRDPRTFSEFIQISGWDGTRRRVLYGFRLDTITLINLKKCTSKIASPRDKICFILWISRDLPKSFVLSRGITDVIGSCYRLCEQRVLETRHSPSSEHFAFGMKIIHPS